MTNLEDLPQEILRAILQECFNGTNIKVHHRSRSDYAKNGSRKRMAKRKMRHSSNQDYLNVLLVNKYIFSFRYDLCLQTATFHYNLRLGAASWHEHFDNICFHQCHTRSVRLISSNSNFADQLMKARSLSDGVFPNLKTFIIPSDQTLNW